MQAPKLKKEADLEKPSTSAAVEDTKSERDEADTAKAQPVAPKKNIIAKICPECKQQVPVACKSCPCGHFFYNARRIAKEFAMEAEFRRRTGRVRREKPNYYDALEYDRHIKKMKKRLSECDNEDDDEKKEKDKRKKRVRREEEEEDEIRYTPEMSVQCQLVLDQLNMKMKLVTWKPSS